MKKKYVFKIMFYFIHNFSNIWSHDILQKYNFINLRLYNNLGKESSPQGVEKIVPLQK